MDKTLKRLLDAEMQAEQIARQADDERERLIQEAMLEARAEESRFQSRVPEIHARFQAQAEARAEQAIGELKRRYDLRHTRLRDLAEKQEERALDAAFALLTDPDLDA